MASTENDYAACRSEETILCAPADYASPSQKRSATLARTVHALSFI